MPSSTARRALSGLLALGVAIAITPFLWRVAVARWGPPLDSTPSYLPSVEPARPRRPFDAGHIWGLQNMQPGIVVIGDSMAGRVDPARLDQLMQMPVAPLLRAASGSGYWYLAFKNYVVASGVKPKWTLVFFRDTNLTDLLFRLLGDYRPALDDVAGDREDELDRVVAARLKGPWYQLHAAAERAYGIERARSWLEPALTAWPARVLAGSRGGPRLQTAVNESFGLDKLRVLPGSDMGAISARDTDFGANVNASVLPLFLELAARENLRLCFVRTQRRMPTGGLRPQTPALQRYMRQLRTYIEERGGFLIDDQDDPAVTALPYDDLDHIARAGRVPYTEHLAARLKAFER